jgi:hypothetical protein
MTSHKDYVATQDADQLEHLIKVANERLENLNSGGWVDLWVVGSYGNDGFFPKDEYERALAFMYQVGQKYVKSSKDGHYPELTLEMHRFRQVEAQKLVEDTRRIFTVDAESAKAID